jgi:Arc/MetJ-type ribon-helix-helix transcriptional regulator
MATAGLQLPPVLEKFVATQVEEGVYPSRRAAIVAAVASEKRRAAQRVRLEAQLQKGLDSGIAAPLNVDAVIRRGRGR